VESGSDRGLSAEDDLGLEDATILHESGDGRLDEGAEPAEDAGLELDRFARARGAEDFGVTDGCEFEVQQWGDGGVGLGDRAGELGGGFDQEHTREEWLMGEMPGKEGFIAADLVLACAGLAGVELGEAIEEPEFGAVGKGLEGGEEVLIHVRNVGLWTWREREGGRGSGVGLDDFPIGIEWRVEEGGIELGISVGVGEFIAHGGAVGELDFGGLQREWMGVEEDRDAGHETPCGRGDGLEEDVMLVGAGFDIEEAESGDQFGCAAGESGFDQGEGIAPGPVGRVLQGESFHPIQARVDDEHAVGLTDGDRLRRIAKFPTEPVRGGEPDAAGGGEGLDEGLEGAGLDDIGGPGLEVGLGTEPSVDDRVVIGRRRWGRVGERDREGEGEGEGNRQRERGEGQMGTKWYH
jgi:hypothetical protein